jgi:hypothetical protein
VPLDLPTPPRFGVEMPGGLARVSQLSFIGGVLGIPIQDRVKGIHQTANDSLGQVEPLGGRYECRLTSSFQGVHCLSPWLSSVPLLCKEHAKSRALTMLLPNDRLAISYGRSQARPAPALAASIGKGLERHRKAVATCIMRIGEIRSIFWKSPFANF